MVTGEHKVSFQPYEIRRVLILVAVFISSHHILVPLGISTSLRYILVESLRRR